MGTKVIREYRVEITTMSRCDICKRFFRTAYDFIPLTKTHNFDNVVVCISCLSHLPGFEFDLKEVQELNEHKGEG
jgi:hypothetical protein